ncbi:VOC family protein [Breznakiella homolactica]|uniref:VOC domain-containing protein n=1 Tax=Breznakiella homolactica TaxID=2798577 RepID=A0A7T7XJC6_9SPIR|nr:VOC family protein [Breznakiella homolactica]QQO07499.1 hypothetical protein JFL75_11065 [Breznakiella homolactica]
MSTLLVVQDTERSKKFYTGLLDQEIVMDLGANVSMKSGIALQTLETWAGFIGKAPGEIRFGGLSSQLYFEVADLDAFTEKLNAWGTIEKLHEVREFPWGQRVIRFFDPDRHVIEVSEEMTVVVKRYLRSGMSAEQTAEKTMFPLEFVEQCRSELPQ